MSDTFDFIGGILLGTFLGSLATLVHHVQQLRQEARQNYIRLSLAQAEVVSLERTLEIHRRNPIVDLPQQIQSPAEPGSDTANALPLIPLWMADGQDPAARAVTSEQAIRHAGKT